MARAASDPLTEIQRIRPVLPETTERLSHGAACFVVRGWRGVRVDVDPYWDEMADIVAAAYRRVAPTTLAARLD